MSTVVGVVMLIAGAFIVGFGLYVGFRLGEHNKLRDIQDALAATDAIQRQRDDMIGIVNKARVMYSCGADADPSKGKCNWCRACYIDRAIYAEATREEVYLALKALYDDTASYIEVNHLGGMDNQVMRQARAALAKKEQG